MLVLATPLPAGVRPATIVSPQREGRFVSYGYNFSDPDGSKPAESKGMRSAMFSLRERRDRKTSTLGFHLVTGSSLGVEHYEDAGGGLFRDDGADSFHVMGMYLGPQEIHVCDRAIGEYAEALWVERQTNSLRCLASRHEQLVSQKTAVEHGVERPPARLLSDDNVQGATQELFSTAFGQRAGTVITEDRLWAYEPIPQHSPISYLPVADVVQTQVFATALTKGLGLQLPEATDVRLLQTPQTRQVFAMGSPFFPAYFPSVRTLFGLGYLPIPPGGRVDSEEPVRRTDVLAALLRALGVMPLVDPFAPAESSSSVEIVRLARNAGLLMGYPLAQEPDDHPEFRKRALRDDVLWFLRMAKRLRPDLGGD